MNYILFIFYIINKSHIIYHTKVMRKEINFIKLRY